MTINYVNMACGFSRPVIPYVMSTPPSTTPASSSDSTNTKMTILAIVLGLFAGALMLVTGFVLYRKFKVTYIYAPVVMSDIKACDTDDDDDDDELLTGDPTNSQFSPAKVSVAREIPLPSGSSTVVADLDITKCSKDVWGRDDDVDDLIDA